MTVIEPELLHLNDEIQILCNELNVVSLQNDIINVKDNFIRIATDVRERFDRLVDDERKRFCDKYFNLVIRVLLLLQMISNEIWLISKRH